MGTQRPINWLPWILTAGILLILGVGTFAAVSAIQNAIRQTQEAARPVTELSTQVARLMRPTPTIIVDPVVIIRQVRSLSRLETIQYTIQRVITAEVGGGAFSFLFRDRLLFIAHGYVIAGVDLQKLRPDDILVRDNILYIQLPEAEIFVATLDNEKSYIYDRNRGILTRGDVQLETAARRVSEREIREAALDDGILEVAQQNAENFLYRLLMDLGDYSDVIFLEPTPQP
jgi:hypothetical protein